MSSADQKRWELGFTADRRWQESGELAGDRLLLARLGSDGALLLAAGIRELLTNLERHGAPDSADARLSFDVTQRKLRLEIPGNPFNSVDHARSATEGFLSRFHVMLKEDGVDWSWSFKDKSNCIEFSLSDARFWIEPEENGDE